MLCIKESTVSKSSWWTVTWLGALPPWPLVLTVSDRNSNKAAVFPPCIKTKWRLLPHRDYSCFRSTLKLHWRIQILMQGQGGAPIL